MKPLAARMPRPRRLSRSRLAALAALCLAVSGTIVVATLGGARLLPSVHAEASEVFPGFTAVDTPGPGFVVTSVENASAAERAGLATGDHISEVNESPVQSPRQAQLLLKGPAGERFELGLVHNRHPRHIMVTQEQVPAKRASPKHATTERTPGEPEDTPR